MVCLKADLGQRESTLEIVKTLAEESQEATHLQSLDVSVLVYVHLIVNILTFIL